MKKITCLLLLIMFSLGLVSCGIGSDESTPTPDGPTHEETNNPTQSVTKAFVAQDSNGKVLLETDNLWSAIIAARDASKSSNKCVVLDSSGQ